MNIETDSTDANGTATSSTLIAKGVAGGYSLTCTGSGTAAFTRTNALGITPRFAG